MSTKYYCRFDNTQFCPLTEAGWHHEIPSCGLDHGKDCPVLFKEGAEDFDKNPSLLEKYSFIKIGGDMKK